MNDVSLNQKRINSKLQTLENQFKNIFPNKPDYYSEKGINSNKYIDNCEDWSSKKILEIKITQQIIKIKKRINYLKLEENKELENILKFFENRLKNVQNNLNF